MEEPRYFRIVTGGVCVLNQKENFADIRRGKTVRNMVRVIYCAVIGGINIVRMLSPAFTGKDIQNPLDAVRVKLR